MANRPRPLVLLVLDGWGHSDDPESNAIHAARSPVWDRLWAECPHGLISGSGEDVGLPDGQMGNSEVGHMNLGAGRVVYQDFTRISKAIADGEFFTNPVLTEGVHAADRAGGRVHILGLLSPGGVHSHENHILAMAELAIREGAGEVYVHAFLDGRDMPPRSAKPSLERVEKFLRDAGRGRIASVIGRYYAMDRDNRWDRVEKAWRLLTRGEAEYNAASPVLALEAAYERDEDDEFVDSTLSGRVDDPDGHIRDGDAVVFMNFRADRARQLSRAFLFEDFDCFERGPVPKTSAFVTLTRYADDIPAPAAYPPADLHNVLGEYLSALGRTQLRIAETEKYAHVTFFFNGGREEPFEGEDRILVPSPKVATYDLQPEMSAFEVTDKLVAAIRDERYDVIICNYANGDMVGHTGNFEAAVQAVEAVDQCLGRIVEALEEVGGECLITADHGNVEKMSDASTGQAHTAHTSEPVPLVYITRRKARVLDEGTLADVAPTMLHILGIPQPNEMTGSNLVEFE